MTIYKISHVTIGDYREQIFLKEVTKCHSDKLPHSIEIKDYTPTLIHVGFKIDTKSFVLTSNFLQGELKMKSIASIFTVGILALLLSTQANAESTHTAQAMEHAGMAQAHGEDGHAKVLLKHATAALKHAKEAENAHADAHVHITEGVKHLEEAVKHAKMGHADEATKHTKEAISHIRQSTVD